MIRPVTSLARAELEADLTWLRRRQAELTECGRINDAQNNLAQIHAYERELSTKREAA